MTRLIACLAALALALTLTACAAPQTGGPEAEIVDQGFESGTWGLIDLDGDTPTTNVRLSFSEGRITGQGPCNSVNGSYEKTDGFGVNALVTTRIACPDLDEENRILSILLEAVSAEVVDNVLMIGAEDGRVLRFRAVL